MKEERMRVHARNAHGQSTKMDAAEVRLNHLEFTLCRECRWFDGSVPAGSQTMRCTHGGGGHAAVPWGGCTYGVPNGGVADAR